MATYNAAKTVENSLLSLICQDYENKEIIVVDGASKDGTQQIVQKYADKLTYFISEPDNGIHDAINKGVKLATGDIIGFLNSDDWYAKPDVLSTMVKNMLPETDVYSGFLLAQTNNKWRTTRPDPELERLYWKCTIPWPASFFKKETFEKYGFLNAKYLCSGDHEYWLRLYKMGAHFQFEQQLVTLMFDGGISSDPLKIALKEDREIALQYGIHPILAFIAYWKSVGRIVLVRGLRYVHLDEHLRALLHYEPRLSNSELEANDISVERPWFLDCKAI